MSVSSVQSGYQIVDMSSKMAEEAALEIRDLTTTAKINNNDQGLEFNKVDFPTLSESEIEPLTKLTQASQYNKIGTNVMQRDQDMIGSLLDIHV
jgi:hypothetical protein